MPSYPEAVPYDHGLLDVDQGHSIYWECLGAPEGKTAVVLHGGPGAPVGSLHRTMFDPERYRVVFLHQRGCGLSTPHASAPEADLSSNTTPALVADLERLRRHLDIERWLILGGSWGSALALAYAQSYPERVTELILFSVFVGRKSEIDRVFGGELASRFPRAWARLRSAVGAERDADVVKATHGRLFDADASVRRSAAYEWCVWESAIVDDPAAPRVQPLCRDDRFTLAFARIVTHYVLHDAWLGNGALLEGAWKIAHVPTVLIHGEKDPQTGTLIHELEERLAEVEVVRVPGAGHGSGGLADALSGATKRFAPD